MNSVVMISNSAICPTSCVVNQGSCGIWSPIEVMVRPASAPIATISATVIHSPAIPRR